MKLNQNPATYMLEVLSNSSVDFHAHYVKSQLCKVNATLANKLGGNLNSNPDIDTDIEELQSDSLSAAKFALSQLNAKLVTPTYQTSYWHQFKWIFRKTFISYWRTPTYNLGRLVVAILIAFIFSSAYPNQQYNSPVAVISRYALILFTMLYLTIISAQSVMPVTADELVAFYREQQCNMYSPWIYSLCNLLVEIPYVILASLFFVLPFFYFVGFQNVGDVAAKFGYYWLFIGLIEMTMISMAQMLVASTPSVEIATALGGVLLVLFCLFAGFIINPIDIPTFFMFVYWLNPLHYAFEGIVVTQFNGDTTPVSIFESTSRT